MLTDGHAPCERAPGMVVAERTFRLALRRRTRSASVKSEVGDAMKLVTAVVKLEKLDQVVQAVAAAGGRGLTATEVRGFGQEYGHHAADRPANAALPVLPRLRIEVLVADQLAWPVAEAIAKAVSTGTIGDGKIWIGPVEGALRVRTGERDLAAV